MCYCIKPLDYLEGDVTFLICTKGSNFSSYRQIDEWKLGNFEISHYFFVYSLRIQMICPIIEKITFFGFMAWFQFHRIFCEFETSA